MIIDFSITNFRGIKDKVTLSFEPENSLDLEDYYFIEPAPGLKLLKLGLVYGANGSGKTTILKALDFLRRQVLYPPTQKQSLLKFSPFLFDQETPKQETVFELTFVYDETKYHYYAAITQRAVVYERLDEYSPSKSLVFERNTDQEKQLVSIKFGSKAKVKKAQLEALEANTLWNNLTLNGFLKTTVDSKALRNVSKWFLMVLHDLIDPQTDLSHSITRRLESGKLNKPLVIQLLKKADFKISDISLEKQAFEYGEEMLEIIKLLNKQSSNIAPGSQIIEEKEAAERTEIRFQHSILRGQEESKYILPYEEESEGTKRYFQFAGLLEEMLSGNNVFLIDELESSLHPDLLKHFLLIFLVNVKNSQLIATTHYRELLLDRDILRDDVLWFTEKKDDGSTELYSLSDFDSSVVRDTTSIFNAYRSGKLGAVPQLSDYYLNLEDGQE